MPAVSWAAPTIRTPDQRLRVFVSSTLEELAPERAAARRAIEQLRLAPVMFEISARSHPPRALYKAYVEQSEIFVGIYWQRYGWVAPDMAISGLEDEYCLCGEERPSLIYVKQPAPDRDPRLADFLRQIEDAALASYKLFETPQELADVLADDLAILLSEGFGWGTTSPPGAARVLDAAALPVPLTRLVDRERELDELCALVDDDSVRLVTITGAGGTGKTRLALETAHRAADGFRDGAFFLDLAATFTAEGLLVELARVLGLTAEGRTPLAEVIANGLGDRRVLLVLDNFEQISDGAPSVATLLQSCARACVMATSRVPLLVRGEHEFRAAPLPTGSGESDETLGELASAPATQLFMERATDARPGFALSEDNAAAIAEICRRLDGLPLALELAAARIRILSPEELLARLRHRLDLAATLADLPERQRTLRATIAWSYELLPEPERDLFAQLAAFAGGFTLDAVEAVCGGDDREDCLDTLSSLVEKSLVTAETSGAAEPRFRMLETVREYARERLEAREDAAEVARRHAHHYVRLCERCGPHLEGPDQGLWFARLDADLANIRALVDWASESGEPELVIRAWSSTMLYWWVRDYAPAMRPALEKIVPLLERDPASARGHALWLLATCRLMAGERDSARPLFEEALSISRRTGDPKATVLALAMLGALAATTTGPNGARTLHQEALAIARDIGWQWGTAYALHHLGDTAIQEGDVPAGIEADTECLALARELGNEQLTMMALWQLGWQYLFDGDVGRARKALTEAAEHCIHARSITNLSYCLDGLAGVVHAEGNPLLAARLIGASEAARDRLRVTAFPPLVAAIEEMHAPVRAALGEAKFAVERKAGAAIDPEDALALATGDRLAAAPAGGMVGE